MQSIIADNTCSCLKPNAVIVGNNQLTCKGAFEDTPEEKIREVKSLRGSPSALTVETQTDAANSGSLTHSASPFLDISLDRCEIWSWR